MIIFKEKLVYSAMHYDTFSKNKANDPLFK